VAWQRAGADSWRVAGVLQFLHRQRLGVIGSEIAAGRTFVVPAVQLGEGILPVKGSGMFGKPELQGTEDEKARKQRAGLDIGLSRQRVKEKIAALPPSRPRGRRPKK